MKKLVLIVLALTTVLAACTETQRNNARAPQRYERIERLDRHER
jgi:hypothetical protein